MSAGIGWRRKASHHVWWAKTQGRAKHDFRSHGLVSHVNDSAEDKEAKVPSYRRNN